jgi:hypothetical protein
MYKIWPKWEKSQASRPPLSRLAWHGGLSGPIFTYMLTNTSPSHPSQHITKAHILRPKGLSYGLMDPHAVSTWSLGSNPLMRTRYSLFQIFQWEGMDNLIGGWRWHSRPDYSLPRMPRLSNRYTSSNGCCDLVERNTQPLGHSSCKQSKNKQEQVEQETQLQIWR